MNYYQQEIDNIYQEFKTSEKGLSQSEAEERLETDGLNELQTETKIDKFKIFISQFQSFIIYIMLFAVLLSLLLQEYVDASVILTILVANAFIGTCGTPGGKTWWNEYSGMMGESGASLSPEFIEFVNRQLRSDLESGEALGQLWRAPPNPS